MNINLFVLATANHFAGCLSANPTVEAKRNDFYANVLTPTGPDVRMPSVFPPLREGPPLSDDVPVSVTVPSSASKSVAGTHAAPEENDCLTFNPMSLMGSFTDHDMSKKQFVNVVLPSGTVSKKCVKVSMSDDLTSVVLMVLMPSLISPMNLSTTPG